MGERGWESQAGAAGPFDRHEQDGSVRTRRDSAGLATTIRPDIEGAAVGEEATESREQQEQSVAWRPAQQALGLDASFTAQADAMPVTDAIPMVARRAAQRSDRW